MRRLSMWGCALSLCLIGFGCGEDPPTESPAPVAESEPAEEEAAGEEEEAAAPTPRAPSDPNEACARVIVVAWQGALAAGEQITRSEDEARARAEELLQRLERGADMAELAREESDASSSGPRGGMLGTYTRDAFPPVHEPIREAVFGLQVHQTSEVVRAPYGWVIARRCPVEKVTSAHILIRYAGAPNAGEEITRSRDEARTLAEDLRGQLDAPGADFAAMAREHSEDGSAERGGVIGSVGRGLLQPPYEEAAFGLDIGGTSPVVETRYGFHIIRRLPDED